MAASVRPAKMVNPLPGPVPVAGPVAGPPPLAGPSRPSTTPPSPTLVRHTSPTRPLSGMGFVANALRPSSSLSRPSRPTISIFNGTHNDSSLSAMDRRYSLSATSADRDRGSWSVPSSASGSKNSSFVGTPGLSRRGSAREPQRPQLHVPARSGSTRGREERPHSAISEVERAAMSDAEVTETPQLRLQRDPETGKKMINQYLVMQEIGHGTHGRVRLGRDTSVETSPDDLEVDLATGSGPLYAIKIVERNPKKKRLAGLQRGKNDGAKRVAENEIRKEIAIFKKVHHPNVVRMKEIIDDPESSKLFMILEYCEGGEVQWKGPNGGPALSLAQTRSIFRDTLLGLEYLHHQGIIHRDIKPSNLLRSGGKVKIADFGCSHYSEALFAASAGEGEAYVDDIELAKTAGSPAFFAPEMCYSEVDEPRSPDSEQPRVEMLKVGDTTIDLTTPTPTVATPESEPRTKARHPITNAIDVWALGVTLYCLLFGKTPFDAPNEYLLMQVIPTAQYPIPATMSSDRLPTGANATEEVREALDLLSRLLEKDPMKRISLEQAKRHPFTLRGMADAQGWLARTDPHAQTRVTVTNDEVTAAVTRGGIRERFKRHFKSISTRLGFLGGRGRSQSVNADSDANDHSGSSGPEGPPSRKAGSLAMETSVSASGISSTNLARRLSMLTRDRNRGGSHGALGAESPRPGLLASALERNASPDSPDGDHLRPPSNQCSAESTPRQLPSMASLDKIRAEASTSPTGRGRVSMSLDAERQRPRSTSNASSSGSIFSALGRGIFSRENSKRGSHRSNGHPIMKSRASFGSTDEPDNVFASSIDSHPPVFGTSVSDHHGSEYLMRRSMDEIGRRQSMETFESGSPGSVNGSLAHHFGPSPDRIHTFESRFRGTADLGVPLRRGSTLSEDIRPVMEDEEVDWEGDMPDSDDCASDDDSDDGLPPGHGFRSAPADWNLAAALDDIERKKMSPANSPVRAHSLLRASGGLDMGRLNKTSASHSSFASSTSFRAPPSAYRAKSPLGETPAYSYSLPASQGSTTPERFQDAEEEDDGLVLGTRRGRKGSTISRQSSVMGRSPKSQP